MAAFLKKTVYTIARVFNAVAQIALVVMMLITLAVIISRPLRISFTSGFDFIILLGPFVFILAWANTQVHKGHLHVDMVISLLPKRLNSVISVFISLLSVCISVLMAWFSFELANDLRNSGGMVSSVTAIPLFPVVYVLACGIALFAIVLFVDVINSLFQAVKK